MALMGPGPSGWTVRVRPYRWVLGPLSAAIAGALWIILSTLPGLGPLDRAQATALLGLPVLVTAPYMTALAATTLNPPIALRVVAASSGVVLVIIFGVLATAGSVVGCVNVNDLQLSLRAAAVGLVASAGFGLAGFAALRQLRQGRRLVAWAVGASIVVLAGMAASGAFLVLYPAYSCAAQ